MDIQTIKRCFPDFDTSLYNEIVQHGALREIKEGEIIMRMGQTIRYIILVLEGMVKLYRKDGNGGEFFIYYINAGQACVLTLIAGARRRPSEVLAKAETDVVLLTIPFECMDKWMSHYKSWYQFVIKSYQERFDDLLNIIDAIAFSTIDERLEFYLQRQVDQFGPNLKLTHQEIANDLHSAREVISRLLKKLVAKHYIILHRSTIEWIKT